MTIVTGQVSQRNVVRKLIRSRRQQLSMLEQNNAAQSICDQLSVHPKVKAASTIALYLANDSELDLKLFSQWCWQQSKQLCLPVLHPFCKGHLLFLKFDKQSTLTTNVYGIKEPKLDVTKVMPLANLDVLITPLVAFDHAGNRMGMGGGFYDRTLSHWQKQPETSFQHSLYPIGVAHQCQQIDTVPTEHWDIPLPEIISV